jgi:tetratricopeptide (TPR) repeat protein
MITRRNRLLTLLLLSIFMLFGCSEKKSAEEYLQDGRERFENGDFSKAIAALEEALKSDPELAEAHRLLGQALGESGRWYEAVEQLKKYQTLAQDEAAAYFLLGQAYVQTADLKNAAAEFAEGVRVDPTFLASHEDEIAEVADDFLKAGRDALAADDLDTATELLTLVAPLAPDQGEVFFLLGEAHLRANDVVESLAAYANAVGLRPDLVAQHSDEINEVAQQGLEAGQAAFDAGDLDTASRVMGAVTALLPEDAKAHFLLGNIFNEANQFAQAIEQYQTVLTLEPDSSSARTNMGVVYYKMGDLETAIQEYNKALDIEMDDAETHYLLGAAYVQREQWDEGKAEFEAALELDSQFAPPYIGLGNVYLFQGDLQKALEALDQAAVLSPNSPEAYFALGQVHLQLGNTAEARNALERVLTLNPAPHWREQVEQMLASLATE